MNANFSRSWISLIKTLKQPASARDLEKGEQSFSRPLLGAAAYLFILCEIHERSVLLTPPPLSSVRLLPLFSCEIHSQAAFFRLRREILPRGYRFCTFSRAIQGLSGWCSR
ncbi:MAG: hypothetical protein J5738_03440 [Lachnospiraceae bacterium]|nr:hypothetical protein [Lachnospiraceae bacterium]